MGLRRTACVALLAATAAPHRARGQVVLDGSLGPAGPRAGPNFVIPASLGRQQGGNLFHSFSQFNINRTESLAFTGPPVANVLARVTGGSASNIDGQLRVDIAGANFYLINPAGVVFGPEARLEVSGSVVVTTADALRFADGASFPAAAGAGPPVLSSAAPVAFGFLSPRPRGVEFVPGPSRPRGLFAAPGKNLSVVAGPVRIEQGRLVAVGGRVNVVSVASAGEVRLDATSSDDPADVSALAALGPVELLDGASLEGPGGGKVVVRGDSLRLDHSKLNADSDDTPGGGIDVDVRGRLDVVHGRVASDNSGDNPGGPIRLRADAVALEGLSPELVAPISTNTKLGGRGGDVVIDAGEVHVAANAAVTSFVEEGSAARGGDISVTAAREVTIDGAGATALTGLAAETFRTSTGTSGNVTVSAPLVRMTERAEVTTTTRGSGPAGTLLVRAQRLEIDGRNADTLTGLQARVGSLDGEGATGAGGTVVVHAGALSLVDGGVISASTFGRGAGGSVRIDAGTVDLAASDPMRFTGIFSRTVLAAGGGPGGDVTVNAARVEARGPAEISASSTGSGTAGLLNVAATRSVRVRRGASITVAAGFPDPRPLAPGEPPPPPTPVDSNAGGLVVSAGRGGIRVLRGSTISARARLDSGSVKLSTPGVVRVVGSTITAEAGRAAGDNGVVDIDPSAVVLSHTTINGLTPGQDVPVVIDPRAVFLRSESRILTDSLSIPPEIDIASRLARLPAAISSAAARLRESCAARFGGDVSSSVGAGRGGVPPEPGGWTPDTAGARDSKTSPPE